MVPLREPTSIRMDAGYVGLDWRVDECSRARAAMPWGEGAEPDNEGERGQGDGEGDDGENEFNRLTNSGILSAIAQMYIFL